jgi:hypothetical protein
LYADDEALYHPYNGGIIMPDWDYPLIGNFVIVGTDEDGDNQDAQSTLDEIRSKVRFLSKSEVASWGRPQVDVFSLFF